MADRMRVVMRPIDRLRISKLLGSLEWEIAVKPPTPSEPGHVDVRDPETGVVYIGVDLKRDSLCLPALLAELSRLEALDED